MRSLQSCIPQQDAYEITGVSGREAWPASEVEQRKLRRAALARAHPDKGGDATAFCLAVWTFDMLMDPSRRGFYDAHGWPGSFRCQVHVRFRAG